MITRASIAALLLLAAPPEDALHTRVSVLFDQLALEGRTPWADADLCVVVRVEPGGSDARLDLQRVLGGLARAELQRRGFTRVIECAGEDTRERADQAARAAGADGLLWIELGAAPSLLRGELRAIDPGLWIAPPAADRVAIHAVARTPLDEKLLAAWTAEPQPLEPRPGPRAPKVTRIGRLAQRVLALAACDLTGDGKPELIVVSDELLVLRLDRPLLEPLARLGFDPLPPALHPVRDPIAGVVCADLDGDGTVELAHGHSSFARGRVATVQRTAGGLKLEPGRELQGIPLALIARGTLLSAHSDGGTNRWARDVWIGPPASGRVVLLPRPFFDVAAHEGQVLVVDDQYRVDALDAGLSRTMSLGSSGRAPLLLPSGPRRIAVRTSSRASGYSDELALGELSGPVERTVPLPGLIHASTWSLAPDAQGLDLWLAVRDATGEQIFRVFLPEPPR